MFTLFLFSTRVSPSTLSRLWHHGVVQVCDGGIEVKTIYMQLPIIIVDVDAVVDGNAHSTTRCVIAHYFVQIFTCITVWHERV